MRHVRLSAIAALVVALNGCITSTTLVTVKLDGSGTIEQTTAMSAAGVAQIAMIGGAFGGKTDPKNAPASTELFTEADARATAAKLGVGVRYVSSEPVKTATSEGRTSIYAFDSITDVRIDQKPRAASGMGTTAESVGGSEKEEMLFTFVRQDPGTSRVTVTFPTGSVDDAAVKAQKDKVADEVPSLGTAMMAQIFKGMRIDIAMAVEGRIVRTNGEFVNGSTVTLLELDFDKLAADPALLQKLGQPKSLEEAKELLRGIPGFKINADREVTVVFARR